MCCPYRGPQPAVHRRSQKSKYHRPQETPPGQRECAPRAKAARRGPSVLSEARPRLPGARACSARAALRSRTAAREGEGRAGPLNLPLSSGKTQVLVAHRWDCVSAAMFSAPCSLSAPSTASVLGRSPLGYPVPAQQWHRRATSFPGSWRTGKRKRPAAGRTGPTGSFPHTGPDRSLICESDGASSQVLPSCGSSRIGNRAQCLSSGCSTASQDRATGPRGCSYESHFDLRGKPEVTHTHRPDW